MVGTYLLKAPVSTGPQVLWHLWLLDASHEKFEMCSQNVLFLASLSILGTRGNEILTRALPTYILKYRRIVRLAHSWTVKFPIQ